MNRQCQPKGVAICCSVTVKEQPLFQLLRTGFFTFEAYVQSRWCLQQLQFLKQSVCVDL